MRTLFSLSSVLGSSLWRGAVLPTNREEPEALGWDSCDIILVTGDAYRPSQLRHGAGRSAAGGARLSRRHPGSAGLAQCRAVPRARVPNLFWGVTGGNMDSMVNRYTSDRRLRSDDAYSPDGQGGLRPDRAVVVYAKRCREAGPDVPVGRRRHRGQPAPHRALRLLVGSRAPIDPHRLGCGPLVYGNAERAIVEIAHRLGPGCQFARSAICAARRTSAPSS